MRRTLGRRITLGINEQAPLPSTLPTATAAPSGVAVAALENVWVPRAPIA
jgi:hypothetical protein